MRKYQQLLLVTISSLSIIVLFVYKSENTRLKDVLNVVNFFGRNATSAKLESNSIGAIDASERFMFTVPYPAWQLIGGAFYAYSAYWKPKDFRNEIGGEVIAVVSAESVLVNFQCSLLYERKKRVKGKFRFERVANAENGKTGTINYHFFCQSTEKGEPGSVVFVDNNTKSKISYTLKLRSLAEERTGTMLYAEPLLPTVCVDLVSDDAADLDMKVYETRLLQFFMHYHIMGVRHFIVYNGDTLSEKLLSMVHRLNAQLHLLPFNFPFNTNTSGVRSIILRDCLMRTHHQRARLVTLLKSNEFLYLNGQLGIHQTSTELLGQTTKAIQLKVHTYSVCIDETHKLLMDNVHYDPEIKQTDIVMYRKHLPVYVVGNDAIALSQSLALGMRYAACHAMGNDGLHDWQNTLREDFMEYISEVRKRMQLLL